MPKRKAASSSCSAPQIEPYNEPQSHTAARTSFRSLSRQLVVSGRKTKKGLTKSALRLLQQQLKSAELALTSALGEAGGIDPGELTIGRKVSCQSFTPT